MTAGSSVIGGSEAIGKRLFGYRKTDVEHLLSDRDHMLRQAETRIRSSEARIGELQAALEHSENRNGVMQQQLGQLHEQLLQVQQQLEGLAARNAQVEQYGAQVRAEAQRIAAWREHVQGILGKMGPTVDRLLVLVEAAPARVEEALSPVASKMPPLLRNVQDFVQVTRTPPTPPAPPDNR